jgi:hypothetical protein
LANEGDELKLDESSPYLRKILYQKLPNWFQGITLETKFDNQGNSFLVVQKVSEALKKEIEEMQFQVCMYLLIPRKSANKNVDSEILQQ